MSASKEERERVKRELGEMAECYVKTRGLTANEAMLSALIDRIASIEAMLSTGGNPRMKLVWNDNNPGENDG